MSKDWLRTRSCAVSRWWLFGDLRSLPRAYIPARCTQPCRLVIISVLFEVNGPTCGDLCRDKLAFWGTTIIVALTMPLISTWTQRAGSNCLAEFLDGVVLLYRIVLSNSGQT